MYPVSLGYLEARKRINKLIQNGHHAEALVTSVFTFEKTLRRSLQFCAIARGFTSKQVQLLFERNAFEKLKLVWPCFERNHRTLPEFVGANDWQHVMRAVGMRNKLVHGERAFLLADCEAATTGILNALDAFQAKLKAEFSFDGWTRLPVRRKAMTLWLVAPRIQQNVKKQN
jgi:hypothetical protein